ncbi:hypothetical protein [Citreimonas salinaria]|uniref:Uncharacterized protein n=1 Tax=Citreimonas salinaria TaxID=321339 RepID=A0A1H3MGU8_9RHOB|nr:hypothetical protein [Citreimonas salinaria]SDY75910.1 hypothetical protein SAMN05444340_11721 [Citreimonas salinaria]
MTIHETPKHGDDPAVHDEAQPAAFAKCEADLRSRIYALSADMTMLVGMIEGAAVLYDAVDADLSNNLVARRAANAMVPMLDNIIAEASRIGGALDEIEMKGFRYE